MSLFQHNDPKLPPDPFFDMSEEEYQIHRARRIKACEEAELPARILAVAFLLLTLLCIGLAVYVTKHGGFSL